MEKHHSESNLFYSAVDFCRNNIKQLEIGVFLLLLVGFFYLAAQKIGFYPEPWKDEAWLMQPAYEVLKDGRMAMPMFRHRGASIGELVLTDPVFTYLLAGWFKLFGFGMTQARLFNLTLSLGVLLLVFWIGQEWGKKGSFVGVVAVLLLVFDNNYFTSSRFLRNDFASLFFSLTSVAFYLLAKKRDKEQLYWLLSGFCAAMSMLSHLNGAHIAVLLGFWLLIDYGVRAIWSRQAWLVAAGFSLLMLPYSLYCYYKRDIYIAQWRLFTPGREKGLTWEGLQLNFMGESKRYNNWQYGVMFQTENHAVTVFYYLTIAALLLLLAVAIYKLYKKESLSPYGHLLVVLIWPPLFFATEVTNKTHAYLPHLTTWFALAVGMLFYLTIAWLISTWKVTHLAKLLRVAVAVLTLSVSFYYLNSALILALKYRKYVVKLQPDNINSMATIFSQLVSNDLVPVASAKHWYLFYQREDFRAFSRPLTKQILKGEFAQEQYLVITGKRERRKFLEIADKMANPTRKYNLIAEISDTPYGTLWIYYVGNDSKYLSTPTRNY